jgi:hypothetical protein
MKNGYLLDQIGIGVQTAFLKTSLQDYAKRSKPYPLDSAMLLVKDKNPFTEMYDCGLRSETNVDQINLYITTGQLGTYAIRRK